MPATDEQVQRYVDERVRVRCEEIRALLNAINDDKAAIDDVYAALTQPNPTWTDNRTDGVPHLATPNDVLAWNTFITNLKTTMEGDAQLPVVLSLCVRPVNG